MSTRKITRKGPPPAYTVTYGYTILLDDNTIESVTNTTIQCYEGGDDSDDSGGGDGGDDGAGSAGGGNSGGPAGNGPKTAQRLLVNPKCLAFIAGLVLDAELGLAAQDPGNQAASILAFNFAGTSGSTYVGLSNTIQNTNYVSTSTNQTTGGLTTIADTQPGTPLGTNGGRQTVTLYPPYGDLSTIAQGQTIIHEGIHDAFGLSDQQLALAATGQQYPETPEGKAMASYAWNKALASHCNKF